MANKQTIYDKVSNMSDEMTLKMFKLRSSVLSGKQKSHRYVGQNGL